MADMLSLDLDRLPATSLLVMRAGRLVFERYQYSRVPSDRFGVVLDDQKRGRYFGGYRSG